ncbi:phosphatidic acid phosphatase [Babesia ovis]|uniref:Phosphatidic acid phosphatase n=1 Tax=Babesia ovis TaxID=5869 RepID=A0A9W5T8U8_BABOV|nr:phosphatidic acid phosphatase [Babesia ovis]
MSDTLEKALENDNMSTWKTQDENMLSKKESSNSWESPGPLVIPQSVECGSNKVDVSICLENADESYVESVLKECRSVTGKMVRNLCLSYVVFFVVLLIQALCMWSSDRIYAQYTHPEAPTLQPADKEWSMGKLYDHIQAIFHKWNGGERISIRYADVTIGLIFLMVTSKCVFCSPLIPTCQMMIRYLVIMSEIYFIRGIFVLATVVPASMPGCRTFNPNDSFLAQYTHVLLGYFAVVDTCTDMIISGHTAASASIMLMFVLHNRTWYLNTLVMIATGVVCFLLILTRAHYTIDVMFGLLFAVHIYSQHLRMISRVGRSTFKGLQLGSSMFSTICKWASSVELVEERVNLFIRLQHLKEAQINKDAAQMKKLDFYYNIYGIEDDMQPRCVYKGYDEWSFATFRLIGRYFRERLGSSKEQHNRNSQQVYIDDTPSTQT